MDFIQAGSYRSGRLRPIRLICVHTTQGPGAPSWAVPTARGIGNYFASGPGASSHYGVDELETVQYVDDGDTAFCAPGANADGLHIEQCGYAEWDRSHWLNDPDAAATLRRCAQLVGQKAAQYGIPLRSLTPQEVYAGLPGVCDHNTVSLSGLAAGDHWDCGTGYPMDVLIALAAGGNFAPAEEEDEMKPEDWDQFAALINRNEQNTHRAVVESLRPHLDAMARSNAENTRNIATLVELVRSGSMTGGGQVDARAVADELLEKIKAAL